MTVQEAIEICNQFAIKHKVIFIEKGTVGFGRPCVGFVRGNNYLEYNPCDESTHEPLWPENQALLPPDTTPNAYHKHDCIAVLVEDDNYDAGKIELAEWARHIEAQGEVEIVSIDGGKSAIFPGLPQSAIRLKRQSA